MHGHGLLLLAEEEHIDLWTDFASSAVYGAIKRLATEGLRWQLALRVVTKPFVIEATGRSIVTTHSEHRRGVAVVQRQRKPQPLE